METNYWPRKKIYKMFNLQYYILDINVVSDFLLFGILLLVLRKCISSIV